MEEQSRQNENPETSVTENVQDTAADAVQEAAAAEPAPKKAKFGITGSTLKIIAIISMFIDHFGASIVEFYLYNILQPKGTEYSKALICSRVPRLWMEWMGDPEKVQNLDITIRSIGRLAFPIFCFLLVEGFLHTRNMKKYLVRLGIFALVSDLPFDMAFFGEITIKHQNVFFTLFIAVFALLAADHVKKQESFNGFHRFVDKIGFLIAGAFGAFACITSMGSIVGYIIGAIFELDDFVSNVISGAVGFIAGFIVYLVKTKKYEAEKKMRITVGLLYVFAFFTLAELLCTDYGGWGVLAVVAMWLARPAWVNGFNAGVLALTIMSFGEATAFISALPVEMYNGKRGLKMKYFFYAFYPAHLALYVLLRYVLLGVWGI